MEDICDKCGQRSDPIFHSPALCFCMQLEKVKAENDVLRAENKRLKAKK